MRARTHLASNSTISSQRPPPSGGGDLPVECDTEAFNARWPPSLARRAPARRLRGAPCGWPTGVQSSPPASPRNPKSGGRANQDRPHSICPARRARRARLFRADRATARSSCAGAVHANDFSHGGARVGAHQRQQRLVMLGRGLTRRMAAVGATRALPGGSGLWRRHCSRPRR